MIAATLMRPDDDFCAETTNSGSEHVIWKWKKNPSLPHSGRNWNAKHRFNYSVNPQHITHNVGNVPAQQKIA